MPPFTTESAKKAAAARHDEKRQRALDAAKRFRAINVLAEQMTKSLPREALGQRAFAATMKVINDVLAGQIVIRNANEAANIVKVMHEVGMREVGGDAIADPSTMDPAAALEHARMIRDAATARMSEAERKMTVVSGGAAEA